MKELGKFEFYDGKGDEYMGRPIKYMRDESGECWYSMNQRLYKEYPDKSFIFVCYDETGRVAMATNRWCEATPLDYYVAIIDLTEENMKYFDKGAGESWYYKDGKIERKVDLEADIRQQRDLLLYQVDLLSPVYWSSITKAKQNEWIAYRKALLDVPQQEGFPFSVVMPTKPDM